MRELIRKGYIGNTEQLVTLRRVTINEGKARGTQIIEVKTNGGLELDILPDTGLDIGQCPFKGISMSWMSKNGYDSPVQISPHETEFLNTFPGGLLYTCGLRSAGPANQDHGEWHPLHGRYHGLAADHITACIEDDHIIIKGTVRETAHYGHVLEVKRCITIPVCGSEVSIEDEVSNLTPRDEEIMQLYHCNFSYPLLSEKAQLIFPQERETIPRTDFAAEGLNKACSFDEPVPGEEERCYFQLMKNDFSARLQNPDLGICMTMTWSGETLPILTEWRSMASGDYVLGLEPGNSYIMGRHNERENGTLPVLKAFETVKNKVHIAFSEIN